MLHIRLSFLGLNHGHSNSWRYLHLPVNRSAVVALVVSLLAFGALSLLGTVPVAHADSVNSVTVLPTSGAPNTVVSITLSASVSAGAVESFFMVVFTPTGEYFSQTGHIDNSAGASGTFTCSVPFGGSGPSGSSGPSGGIMTGCGGSNYWQPVIAGGGALSVFESDCPGFPGTTGGTGGLGSTSQTGSYTAFACLGVEGGSYGTSPFTISSPASVPQFPLGLALLFAVMVPALLMLRKRTLSLPSPSV